MLATQLQDTGGTSCFFPGKPGVKVASAGTARGPWCAPGTACSHVFTSSLQHKWLLVAVLPVFTSGSSVHDTETWLSSQAVRQIPL